MKKLIILLLVMLFLSCFRAPFSIPPDATIKEQDNYTVYELDDELYIYSTEYGLFKKVND